MVATKRATASASAELLKFAEEASKLIGTWDGLHNAIYGIGGKFGELFPDQASRTAFAKSDEFKQVAKLIEQKRKDRPPAEEEEPASGKFILRLPESMHAALAAEAKAEGVSLNQLCLAKLAMSLKGALRK